MHHDERAHGSLHQPIAEAIPTTPKKCARWCCRHSRRSCATSVRARATSSNGPRSRSSLQSRGSDGDGRREERLRCGCRIGRVNHSTLPQTMRSTGRHTSTGPREGCPRPRRGTNLFLPSLTLLRKKYLTERKERLIRFRGKCALSSGVALGAVFPPSEAGHLKYRSLPRKNPGDRTRRRRLPTSRSRRSSKARRKERTSYWA